MRGRLLILLPLFVALQSGICQTVSQRRCFDAQAISGGDIIVADFTGNGYADLVERGPTLATWHRNLAPNGRQDFEYDITYGLHEYGPPLEVEGVFDFNDDALPDVVVVRPDQCTGGSGCPITEVIIYYQEQTGFSDDFRFDDGHTLALEGGAERYNVWFYDLNSDGRLDIVWAADCPSSGPGAPPGPGPGQGPPTVPGSGTPCTSISWYRNSANGFEGPPEELFTSAAEELQLAPSIAPRRFYVREVSSGEGPAASGQDVLKVLEFQQGVSVGGRDELVETQFAHDLSNIYGGRDIAQYAEANRAMKRANFGRGDNTDFLLFGECRWMVEVQFAADGEATFAEHAGPVADYGELDFLAHYPMGGVKCALFDNSGSGSGDESIVTFSNENIMVFDDVHRQILSRTYSPSWSFSPRDDPSSCLAGDDPQPVSIQVADFDMNGVADFVGVRDVRTASGGGIGLPISSRSVAVWFRNATTGPTPIAPPPPDSTSTTPTPTPTGDTSGGSSGGEGPGGGPSRPHPRPEQCTIYGHQQLVAVDYGSRNASLYNVSLDACCGLCDSFSDCSLATFKGDTGDCWLHRGIRADEVHARPSDNHMMLLSPNRIQSGPGGPRPLPPQDMIPLSTFAVSIAVVVFLCGLITFYLGWQYATRSHDRRRQRIYGGGVGANSTVGSSREPQQLESGYIVNEHGEYVPVMVHPGPVPVPVANAPTLRSHNGDDESRSSSASPERRQPAVVVSSAVGGTGGADRNNRSRRGGPGGGTQLGAQKRLEMQPLSRPLGGGASGGGSGGGMGRLVSPPTYRSSTASGAHGGVGGHDTSSLAKGLSSMSIDSHSMSVVSEPEKVSLLKKHSSLSSSSRDAMNYQPGTAGKDWYDPLPREVSANASLVVSRQNARLVSSSSKGKKSMGEDDDLMSVTDSDSGLYEMILEEPNLKSQQPSRSSLSDYDDDEEEEDEEHSSAQSHSGRGGRERALSSTSSWHTSASGGSTSATTRTSVSETARKALKRLRRVRSGEASLRSGGVDRTGVETQELLLREGSMSANSPAAASDAVAAAGDAPSGSVLKVPSPLVDLRRMSEENVQTARDTPAKCPYCTTVVTRSHLTDHIKNVHERVARFRCKTCGHETYTRSNMKSHVRTHTGNRPFVCHMCDMKFTQKNNLTRHLRARHKTEPLPRGGTETGAGGGGAAGPKSKKRRNANDDDDSYEAIKPEEQTPAARKPRDRSVAAKRPKNGGGGVVQAVVSHSQSPLPAAVMTSISRPRSASGSVSGSMSPHSASGRRVSPFHDDMRHMQMASHDELAAHRRARHVSPSLSPEQHHQQQHQHQQQQHSHYQHMSTPAGSSSGSPHFHSDNRHGHPHIESRHGHSQTDSRHAHHHTDSRHGHPHTDNRHGRFITDSRHGEFHAADSRLGHSHAHQQQNRRFPSSSPGSDTSSSSMNAKMSPQQMHAHPSHNGGVHPHHIRPHSSQEDGRLSRNSHMAPGDGYQPPVHHPSQNHAHASQVLSMHARSHQAGLNLFPSTEHPQSGDFPRYLSHVGSQSSEIQNYSQGAHSNKAAPSRQLSQAELDHMSSTPALDMLSSISASRNDALPLKDERTASSPAVTSLPSEVASMSSMVLSKSLAEYAGTTSASAQSAAATQLQNSRAPSSTHGRSSGVQLEGAPRSPHVNQQQVYDAEKYLPAVGSDGFPSASRFLANSMEALDSFNAGQSTSAHSGQQLGSSLAHQSAQSMSSSFPPADALTSQSHLNHQLKYEQPPVEGGESFANTMAQLSSQSYSHPSQSQFSEGAAGANGGGGGGTIPRSDSTSSLTLKVEPRPPSSLSEANLSRFLAFGDEGATSASNSKPTTPLHHQQQRRQHRASLGAPLPSPIRFGDMFLPSPSSATSLVDMVAASPSLGMPESSPLAGSLPTVGSMSMHASSSTHPMSLSRHRKSDSTSSSYNNLYRLHTGSSRRLPSFDAGSSKRLSVSMSATMTGGSGVRGIGGDESGLDPKEFELNERIFGVDTAGVDRSPIPSVI